MKRLALLALLFAPALACGDGGEAARVDCQGTGTVYCQAFSACPGTVDYNSCKVMWESMLTCEKVTGESGSVRNCQADIRALSCPALTAGTLPSSCVGVFTD